jgi:hypothetical protein
MRATTWVDRITDEENPWLNAEKMEERGDLGSAAALYLDDASANLLGEKLARAALSASCAASCLDALGFPNEARLVYSEVAQLYHLHARRVSRVSVREWMWSLRQSGRFHLVCGESEKAQEVYQEYAVLAGRVELFAESRKLSLFEEGEWKPQQGRDDPPPGDWSELMREVQRFLILRGTTRTARGSQQRRPARGNGKGAYPSYEKNFANQLG